MENEEEVPQAIILGDTDVKFYRVFPWGDDRVLIRLVPLFTDGGAKFLRNYMKEREKKKRVMPQPEPKILSSPQKVCGF